LSNLQEQKIIYLLSEIWAKKGHVLKTASTQLSAFSNIAPKVKMRGIKFGNHAILSGWLKLEFEITFEIGFEISIKNQEI